MPTTKLDTRPQASHGRLQRDSHGQLPDSRLIIPSVGLLQQTAVSVATKAGSVVTLGILAAGLIAFGTQQVIDNVAPRVVEHITIEAVSSLGL